MRCSLFSPIAHDPNFFLVNAIKKLPPSKGREYGDFHPRHKQWVRHDDRSGGVTHMISNVLLNQSRQAAFGMPTSRCSDAAWLRALPMTTGEVSVHTDAKRDRIVVTTDGYAFPGAGAWSPPT